MKIEIIEKNRPVTLLDVPFGDLFISSGDGKELHMKIRMQGSYCGIASVRSGCTIPMNNVEAKSILVKRVNKITVEVKE